MRHLLLFSIFALLQLTGSAQLTKIGFPLNFDARPDQLTLYKGKLLFFANDGINGREPYWLDSAGTLKLGYDINPGPAGSSPSSAPNMPIAQIGDKIYFRGENGAGKGVELYSWDGVNTPMLVADLLPGSSSGFYNNSEIIALDGKLYFQSKSASFGVELWSYDTATNIAQRKTDLDPGNGSSSPSEFAIFNGKLYFSASSAATGQELYCYDPVADTAGLVADVYPGSNSSGPLSLVVIGDKLYFIGILGGHGRELFCYDGVQVKLVADLRPGPASAYNFAADHSVQIIVYKSKIYTTIEDTINSWKVITIDTATGSITGQVWNGSVNSFFIYGDKLYFSGNDMTTGVELWCYDGVNSPFQVADIYPANGSGAPEHFTVYNNELYFSATWGAGLTMYTNLYKYRDSSLFTGVQDLRFDADIKVYPNPARSEAYIDMTLGQNEKFGLSLTDAAGKTVYRIDSKEYKMGNHKLIIPLGQLPGGIYFYQLNGENRSFLSGRLVKQ